MIRTLILSVCLSMGAACTSPSMALRDAVQRGDRQALLEQLARSSETRDDWLIEDAARALGELREAAAVPGLLAVLEDPTVGPLRRASAGRALGRIGKPEAVRPLLAALERASHPEERYWLIVGLYAFCGLDETQAELHSTFQKAEAHGDALIRRAAKKGQLHCSSRDRTAQESA